MKRWLAIKKMRGCISAVVGLMMGAEVSAAIYPQYPVIDYGTGEEAIVAKKGEYLAKAGDCIACHTDTKHNGPAYAGGLAINTPFGVFYSPNITFDEKTGIGKWTEKDFADAMREGKKPDGGFYFPVFPYMYFSKLTDEDIHALYVYMKHVPQVEKPNKPLPFPFNLPGVRYTLIGWNILFFYGNQSTYHYDSSQSEQWNRGAYLVQGLGHCSMCHTPLNPLGAPKNKYYLTGGFIDGYWAPNITKYGLASASPEEIADVFSKDTLINKAGLVQGPMAEVNHDSLMYLTREDHIAMAVYLKTVKSIEPFTPPKEIQGQTSLNRGEQVYQAACSVCHKNGEMGAPIIGDGYNWYLRVQEQGLDALYLHAINGFNSMPPKGACVTCSDSDIKDAVDYLLHASVRRAQWHDLKQKQKKDQTLRFLDGKTIYTKYCSVCHDSGKNGAPRIGDKAAWAPLIKKNMDVLIVNTMNGSKHPKNGGCPECSTKEVIAALKYMVNQSKEEGNYSLW